MGMAILAKVLCSIDSHCKQLSNQMQVNLNAHPWQTFLFNMEKSLKQIMNLKTPAYSSCPT